ncbi:MAG: GNAT family N-acetyltransferase [Cyanosarcina radialis HA8281-LM2]|jgi:phosphinothricin acetyltransferase|nr:GNAT family N-acetyltransferase [Cyanosarcina radialis HA8281-LM2]
MNIRDATELDLPAIVEIYNATIPGRMATADTEPVSSESRLAWFQQRDRATRPIVVMELSAKIVGWLSFQSFYGRPAYRATAELSIYVAPTHLRQGIGHRLLEYAIGRSPELEIETLLGFIFAHNEPSLKLFEQFGFQRWGYLPKVAKLDGIDRDLAILGLQIK